MIWGMISASRITSTGGNMRLTVAAAALLLLSPLSGQAQVPSPFMDGDELREGLQAWDSSWGDLLTAKTVDSGIARGFVVGVADALDGVAFSLPPSVTRGQIKDVVLKHLEEQPGGKKSRASRLTTPALAAAYPCAP